VTEQRPSQPETPASADEDRQVSQGPSGSAGVEDLGGADAVPDTPDKDFGEDADGEPPERRGSALPDD
jgi:hypothetical protein